SLGVGICNECARCRTMPVHVDAADAAIVCDASDVAGAAPAKPRQLAEDATVAAAQVPLHHVMEPAIAVRLSATVGEATRALIERRARSLVVVDAARRPIGIVSAPDLLVERFLFGCRDDGGGLDHGRAAEGDDVAGERSVADVMTPIVHTL